MKSADIRDAFLKFFESKDHTVVASSSLVPANDPTLLFTNAGMVQFKDVFLGDDKRPYVRAASSQRCVRAGGKHNDLENVGYTARHHTFFEMLGNFSFGDYFKRDAIFFAWEFLTKVLNLPADRLWVTVHISDDEAADIWLKEVGVSADRFSRLDEDNFWQMGDTGPCGPSSEIFYDHGADIPGGPPGSENDDLDRYIEIWNLVFMQFERQTDGSLVPLPKPSVDTGMGLERIAAVMQQVHSNYEIDLFQALLKAAAEKTGTSDLENKSLRVIADHIRSCAFMVVDGVLPSNEGRGYVLRRIIRRAIRHGHKLGQTDVFFHQLVSALVEQMGEAYPELTSAQAHVEKVLLAEEQQFAKTLDKGMKILGEFLEGLKGSVIPGDFVFKMHDTYGFPVDLTADIARERDLTIDREGYDKCMAAQKENQGKDAFRVDYTDRIQLEGETVFEGYEHTSRDSVIANLFSEGEAATTLSEGDEGVIVLPATPFYANSGGQVGDTGFIESGSARFEVQDCRKSGSSFLHIGKVLLGQFAEGDAVRARVDESVRHATALNHSATHLLHAALREILGDHVTQKGSLVDSARLRFDISHFEAMTPEEIRRVEARVNEEIWKNTPVATEVCDMETAKARGAMALFGEKYGDEVRVLSMGGDFSIELCGGTHASRTGDIGLFRIVSESGISAGVRRIEAVTGSAAFSLMEQAQSTVDEAAALLKASPDTLLQKLTALVASQKQTEKELESLKAKLATKSADDWLNEAVDVSGVKVLAKALDGVDGKALLDMSDQLKNKLGDAVVLLAGIEGDKVSLVAGVSKETSKRVKAGDLIKHVASQIGGKGGGRPDMARGAGENGPALQPALSSVAEWVGTQIS